MKQIRPENAADPEKVKAKGDREKDGRELELADLKHVLSTRSGRRFVWRMLGRCKIFESVWDHQDSRMAYNCGQQDVGHFLQAEVFEADENAYPLMMREAKGDERV